MRQQHKPAISDLHQRLYQVLPEYKPISQMKLGEIGTWKAINADGDVYLVTWERLPSQVMRRTQTFAMDYQTLVRKSTDTRALKPDEGWDLSGD